MVFVSISIDKNINSMKSYLDKNKNLTTVFLFAGADETIRELYNLKAIPSYYLIDRDGDLLFSPAKKPSDNIEQVFQDLMKKGR
ncbi:MAG: hypothetical protein IPP32_01510 [Bacteroidetes bacterium]|nr:hypothetical protein [Bacteroidota bacterium]